MIGNAVSYVRTGDIRTAVTGRETEILDKIGISWRDGQSHIHCPYRDHPDRTPSWRWDGRKARAFCTCMTRPDSIFDVVMKVVGVDFDAAKIRVAELLGRSDLICNRSGNHQSTSAVSLLNTPAECRDDRLPVAYLAHRLNVPDDAVPIPRTRVVGVKALGYYDAAPAGSSKPKLVGAFPCAVFETVDGEGRAHAHRIYIAASGAGKADLGAQADGQPRNPKKAAKLVGDENIAGRSVLWGDPNCARHLFVTEGIETGAAVALALDAQVQLGEVAVAAAISATGIEAFQPYAITSRVTIAADRDEAPKAEGRPGSMRGERAARVFGLKHVDRLKVDIALPGKPGQTVDWLDVLVNDGVDAVRTGILAAVPFEPTQDELTAVTERRGRAAELKEIAAAYPLPAMDTLTLTYEHTPAGRVKVHKVSGRGGDRVLVPITTPFGIPARLRHANQADAFGLRCLVQDMNDKPRAIDFERAILARMGAAEIRAQLFAAGLRTEGDGDMVAVASLKAADPDREIVIVGRAGWHEFAGCPDPIFITPGGAIIGAPAGFDIELSAAARMAPEVARAGTLEGWCSATSAALLQTGCEHWTLGAASTFAGPIVDLTGLDTCGINASGLTTSGKTTSQRLAVSGWSTPDIRRPGLFESARATDNAIEALAQRSTGAVLALDELAHVNGKIVGKIIYMITGGTGKRRMTAEATLRDSYAWATFAVLSGETSLEQKVRGDGGDWLPGMAVRIIDIDVTGVNRTVDADTLQRINGIERHYGHAGPAFVSELVKAGLHRQAGALRERVLKAATALAGGSTMDSALIRAATPLAILMIAGELAKTFGLIPPKADISGAVQWAWQRFSQSPDAAALDPEAQVIDSIRGWIAERWGVTVKSIDVDTGINNRETLAWYDETTIFIPKSRIREAAGNSLKESEIGAILARRGLLAVRPEADRYTVRWVPKIGRVPAYALPRLEFGRSQHTADPAAPLTVYQGGRYV